MRLSNVVVALAGATVAQVGASPIRIIMVSDSMVAPPRQPIEGARFGHTVGKGNKVNVYESITIPVNMNAHHRPCGGARRTGRFHAKAVQISNAFRKALGLPLIETEGHPHHHHAHPHMHHPGGPNVHVEGGFVSILPHPVPNHAPIAHFIQPMEGSNDGMVHRPPHHHHHHHKSHQLYFGEHNDFLARLHASLMNLGSWEGRAVAFVLGCGIGVLLRLFWVLAIVSYRVLKGKTQRHGEQYEYTHVYTIEEYDADPVPTYSADEKVPVAVEEPVQKAQEPIVVPAEETK